ncbi:MAG TPA: FAD-linked oxidase C-terminal domain-containing protein [Opitutaceae bacterium]|nr:FAD-linked oxidase C-terminal domain-containing protein [Opitutaceae bacterium]
MKPFVAATATLKRRLGAGVVRTDEFAREAASFDSSKIPFLPAAVIFPRHSADLTEVLTLANTQRVPVTVRGRGTTLTGAAAPVRGGWVVDMLAWNRIAIDAEAGMAQVQAGAKVADIQRAAEAKGWFYPPDPSSKEFCTIGGNIACNAGGMHGGKYGVTRDFVLALKGHLPTGEFVEWGTPTKKFSAGFNLRDLWIGSEGMLGIVTEATLKLIPQPAARWTLLAAFKTETDVFRSVRDLFAQRVQPAICEFLDRYSVLCAERATGVTVFAGQPGRPVLLIELAGGASEVREQKRVVLAWAARHALAHRAARNRDEAEALWAVRRKCSGAMFELGDAKLNEDIVVPMRNYEKFARFLDQLRRESKLAIPTFGHLGDGNLHVNIMYHKAVPAECRAAEAAVQRLMETVVALGGAISGEHGIGLAKSPFLRVQHSPAQVAAMQAVKRALDPNGVLNPGKMFEVFEVWKHPRLVVKLPWDHK